MACIVVLTISDILHYYLGQVIILNGVLMCSYFCSSEYYDHPVAQNDTVTTLLWHWVDICGGFLVVVGAGIRYNFLQKIEKLLLPISKQI